VTARSDADEEATSARATRHKNRWARQASRLVARAEWLDARLIFWTGERQNLSRLADAVLPLRAVLQDRLAELPAGLYAVRVDFPGPLRLEVTAVDAVTRALIADTARAIEAVARYPKAGARLVGPVDRWRQGAVAALNARRRAVEGADAWRAGAPDALALEARALWLGAGVPPSAALAESALRAWTTDAREHDPSAAHLAEVALSQRHLHRARHARTSAWAAAGRRLDRWPSAAVAWAATVVGADALVALAAAAPSLNDALAAVWVEERAIDHTPATTRELGDLARLLSALALIRQEPNRRHHLLSRLAVEYLQFCQGSARRPTAAGDAEETFQGLALDLVYHDVRDFAATWRYQTPNSLFDLAEHWLGKDLLGPRTFDYVDHLLAGAAAALGQRHWIPADEDPPTSLSQTVPPASALDPAGAAIAVTVANRLRWKGAPDACAAMAGWIDTCRPLIPLAPFWRDVLAVVPSETTRFDADGARALASSLEYYGRGVATELVLGGGSERAGRARALIPAVLARGPDATAQVFGRQLWLQDEDALDAALRWIGDAARMPRRGGAETDIPVPRAAFNVADPALRDTLLEIGLRAWGEGGAGAREVEQLLAILAHELPASAAACWSASRSALVTVVAPLVRRVLGRRLDATHAADRETPRLVYIILDVCARWLGAGYQNPERLARILADRWASIEAAEEAWRGQDDDRDELQIRLSEGSIPRLLALMPHAPPPRKYAWRAVDGWALVEAHPTARAWVSACLDRTELVSRVVHLLERIALVARLDPGLTAARLFGPLDRVPRAAATWPPWVPPDAILMLEQIARARALAGASGTMPPAVQRLLERSVTLERERAALHARAAGNALSSTQRARLDKLERWVAHPRTHAADRGVELARALPKQLALAGLAAIESLARHDLERRWRQALGGDCPSPDSPAWDNALHLRWSVTHNRRVLARLLRHAARGDHGWMRDLAPNRTFLAGLAAAGLQPDRWLADRSRVLAGPSGPLRAYATTDPLEVLQMGSLFGTCLSAGQFNAYAAVAAAVEANKRVLYVKDRAGRVLGRQLLALTRTGEMIGFTSYGAAADEPGRHGAWVKLALELLALDIARAAGARLTTGAHVSSGLDEGEVKSLGLFCRGYVDSPEAFDWWIEALASAAPRSGAEDRERLRALLARPAPPDLDARASSDWKRDQLGWAACRALLWLGAAAPPLSGEQQAALGLGEAQRALLEERP
jgi:hypothetical protein